MDKELIKSLSDLLDEKLTPIKNDLKSIKSKQEESISIKTCKIEKFLACYFLIKVAGLLFSVKSFLLFFELYITLIRF